MEDDPVPYGDVHSTSPSGCSLLKILLVGLISSHQSLTLHDDNASSIF
jgi:hypothetical protein